MADSEAGFNLRDEVFNFLPGHLNVIRKMVIVWDPAESGAPVVDWENFRFDPEEIINADLLEENNVIELLPSMLERVFEFALTNGTLEKGTYTYDNPLVGYEYDGLLPSIGNETDPLVAQGKISFSITDEHLKLLSHLNTRWLTHWGSPGIDCKRPYGDMTCFYLDMAEILGIPAKEGTGCEDRFTEEQVNLFERLHHEMFYVLQAFLWFSTIEPGYYYRKNTYTSKWEKITAAEYELFDGNLNKFMHEKFDEAGIQKENASKIYNELLECITNRLSDQHWNIKFWISQGIFNTHLEKFGDSIASYNTALKLDASNDMAYGYRGIVYLAINKKDLALNDFEKALRLNPDNTYAKYYLDKLS